MAHSEKRIQVPVRLRVEMHDRLRRLLYWNARGRNMQSCLEAAVLDWLQKIELEENKGKPFRPIPAAE
jgi:hypothetical protein